MLLENFSFKILPSCVMSLLRDYCIIMSCGEGQACIYKSVFWVNTNFCDLRISYSEYISSVILVEMIFYIKLARSYKKIIHRYDV